jgi:hypothetical protein
MQRILATPFINPLLAHFKSMPLGFFLAVEDWPLDAFNLHDRAKPPWTQDAYPVRTT